MNKNSHPSDRKTNFRTDRCLCYGIIDCNCLHLMHSMQPKINVPQNKQTKSSATLVVKSSCIPVDIRRQTGKFTECNTKLLMRPFISDFTTIKCLSLSSTQCVQQENMQRYGQLDCDVFVNQQWREQIQNWLAICVTPYLHMHTKCILFGSICRTQSHDVY